MALAEGTVVFEDPGIPPVINDPETTQAILAAAKRFLRRQKDPRKGSWDHNGVSEHGLRRFFCFSAIIVLILFHERITVFSTSTSISLIL